MKKLFLTLIGVGALLSGGIVSADSTQCTNLAGDVQYWADQMATSGGRPDMQQKYLEAVLRYNNAGCTALVQEVPNTPVVTNPTPTCADFNKIGIYPACEFPTEQPPVVVVNPEVPPVVVVNPELPPVVVVNPELPPVVVVNPELPPVVVVNPELPPVVINPTTNPPVDPAACQMQLDLIRAQTDAMKAAGKPRNEIVAFINSNHGRLKSIGCGMVFGPAHKK